MANNPTSPLDATGRAVEDAAKKNAAELKRRKDEISISRAAEEELLETAVFDPKRPDQPIIIDEIETVGITTASKKTTIIRTITDIEQMTYGVGNTFDFKAGVKYEVPVDLADYLERLGYIWRPN